jgi:hypothetical protein
LETIIVGGFLGSGKTSVVLQLAKYLTGGGTDRKVKLVIIENEIGETGIDDKVLSGAGYEVQSLFSGCVCCTLTGELVSSFRKIIKESVIGTLTCALPLRYQEALAAAEQKMLALAEDIVKRGGIIGHIKSLLTEEGERCMLSITDTDTGVQRRIPGGETSRLELAAIVFCIDDDTLRLCIRDAFADYIPSGT